ncbi:hypothetical protein DVA86_20540 [Streptomyces armeniacus]|uniref:Uncharacterized protein n=1 Tax=Streptomyces armeniacus TaxID=83291 RepID=A0A345XSR7_9ACTN|nr:hypothetical protein [Streptomyces armeniacus]AXK34683.1 hypothetical protein DVA86_20540 [Streptomyces armeniacus]
MGGKGRGTLPEAVSKASARRLKKRRKRLDPPVLATARKGKTAGRKPGSGGPGPKGKGRETLTAAIATESARRLKKRRKRLDPPVLTTARKAKKSKKPTSAGTTPTKVNLTKKPKPTGAGGTAATPKVNLTKKPKPATPGAGSTAPKVNLRKKVKLTKKPRKTDPGKSAGSAGGTGTAGAKWKARKRRSRRGWWDRASSRRSGRAAHGPAGSADPGTGQNPRPEGGFGPPPGWGHAAGTTITVEQVGGEGWAERQRDYRRRAGVAAGAISAGPRTGGTPVSVPVPSRPPNTQYADSDLTIYDVIDADSDMAEEITRGVDEARAAADGSEQMMTRLEALHAKIVELKVPGVLEGWCLLLAEKALSVKAKAEGLAETLPAAAEAISTAGEEAERRHKPLADATRDAGHAAPAERDYHLE